MNIIGSWSFFLYFLYFFHGSTEATTIFRNKTSIFGDLFNFYTAVTTTASSPTQQTCQTCPTCSPPSTPSPGTPLQTKTDEIFTSTIPEPLFENDTTVADEILSPLETTIDETSTSVDPDDHVDDSDSILSTMTTVSPRKVQATTKANISTPILNSLGKYYSNLISNGSDICEQNSEVELLIVVDSNAYDMNLRSVMRSWIKYYRLNKKQTRLVFFVGNPLNPLLETRIHKENYENKDIILSNVPDTSRKYSTMKSISWLHWVATRCHRAKFVMKIDRRVVLNIQNVLTFTRQNMLTNNTIWGFKHTQSSGVSFTGKSYLMTGDTVPKLFCGALKPLVYNPNENQYITGLVAANEKIKVLNDDKFEVLNYFTGCSKIRDNFIFDFPNSSYSDWIDYTYLVEQCEMYLSIW